MKFYSKTVDEASGRYFVARLMQSFARRVVAIFFFLLHNKKCQMSGNRRVIEVEGKSECLATAKAKLY